MRFSILHTSARPDKWKAIYDAWRFAASSPEMIDYILVCDRRWGFDHLPTEEEGFYGNAVWNTGRKCYVDGVNIAAAYASGDVFIVNADDQYPCEHWDAELTNVIRKAVGDWTEPERDSFVVEVSTGTPAEHDRGILVMPVLSRARYDKYGYVLYPAYESMYADNDFCELARRDQCIIDARDLTFPHKHPIFDQAQPWDEAYQQQNRREAYDLGLKILEARRASNFGEVKPIFATVPKEKPSIVLITPGEKFSQPWVSSYFELVGSLMPHFQVKSQMGFSSNVYVTRKCLLEAAKTWEKRPDYLLWIDDDQILTVEALQQLITDLEQYPDLAGVAGWAWCLRDVYGNEPHLSFGVFDDNGQSRRAEYEGMIAHDSDLILIAYSGFPAVLMRGSVLDTMQGDDFLPILDKEQFPPWGISGEDTAFFLRANQKGLQFAVDRRVKVPHLKLRCAEPIAATSLEGAPIQVERTQ